MGDGILKRKIGIEKEVDEFLDRVSEAGLLCKQGMSTYLKGDMEVYATFLKSIRDTEHKGDALRRSLEKDLYEKTLIPESRGDVMELLEDMDALLDRVASQVANRINDPAITDEQKQAVQQLRGKNFTHRWELERALAEQSQEWRMKPNNKEQNEELRRKLDYVYRLIRSTGQ